ncbi:MAG: ATP-binding protein [Phycisphaerae bacterium]
MRVLIADDDSFMLRLLEKLVKQWGYDVVTACDGDEAWAAFSKPDPPQMFLLDWNMPGPSGVEVCRRIRGSEDGAYTYVLLVTGNDEKDEISNGFAAGADDFIVKPFEHVHLWHRLTAGARILENEKNLVESKETLKQYAAEMESLAEERARQLAHAERMATLGMLSAGVAHEINNPTTFISGNLLILKDCWPLVRASLESRMAQDAPNAARLRFMLDEIPKIHDAIANGVTRITKVVSGLKAYAGHRQTSEALFSVNARVTESLELCTNALKHRVKVETDLGADLPQIWGDGQQIDQVFVNLFVNAAHAMRDCDGGTLRIMTTGTDAAVRIVVEDNGPGMSPDVLRKIWEPFFTTKPTGEGTGLGLPIIKGIVEDHGGTIAAEHVDPHGARFVITFPCRRPETQDLIRPDRKSIPERRSEDECAIADCR